MTRCLAILALACVLAFASHAGAGEQMRLKAAYGETALLGPERAKGAVVWSHGRSIEREDSEAPSPLYLQALREDGWDVFRFDRMRAGDTLAKSSEVLAGYAEKLTAKGYRTVALAGQSFGAFLSIIAAGRTDAVDAVIGTAPAAYGNFHDAHHSFHRNSTKLWPILHQIRRARVMLFFFHGDSFDPGGRAEPARVILQGRGLAHHIIDQPARLTGHGAAGSGLFVRRFGACIIRFAAAAPKPDDPPCDEAWGEAPSKALLRAGLPQAASGGGPAPLRPWLGTWYGSYVNGREVVVSIEPAGSADRVRARHILGPGVEPDARDMETVQRTGRLEGDELVFDEEGQTLLRYRLRHDGRLAGAWVERNSANRMKTVLKRVQ